MNISRQKIWNVLALFVLLVVLPGIARAYIGQATLNGSLSDICIALIFLYPLLTLPRRARAPLVLIWVFIHIGAFELFKTMARMPSWSDLSYFFDSEFLLNSFSGISLANLIFPLLFGGGGLLLLLRPKIKLLDTGNKLKTLSALGLVIVMGMFIHAHLISSRSGINIYSQYNPLHWLLVDPFLSEQKQGANKFENILQQDLSGKRFIKKGRAKNVLVITLEGMTGSYLTPSWKHFKLPQPKTEMPLLSEFSKQGMVLPDFVAHSHQTVRGLYSLLCADISKLSWSTPKATQLQNVPQKAALCLPHQLKTRGFSTHYLQAAGLSFMGKDRLMPFIGFDEVHGLEWFSEGPPLDYKWGVDDKTFFEGALSYINKLEKSKKPWFLTLLTVGTHQPYEVPDDFAANFEDAKQASIAYLDQAVTKFLEELKKKNILDDTLVIVTADESHGSELGDWASSWILNIIFAPEHKKLPNLNPVNFGLFDTTLSVLDYLSIGPLPEIPGRSFFRKYRTPRQMVSFTAGRLRWLDDTGRRIECTHQGKCLKCNTQSIIGPADCEESKDIDAQRWIDQSQWLDQNLSRLSNSETLRFADGERHNVKQAWRDQWADNLIGAQYLDFPAHSETQVHIKWKVLKTGDSGAVLKLFLKQAERELHEPIPPLPVLTSGKTGEISFVVQNKQARNGFSFHLLAETPVELEIQDFTVIVKKED